MKETIDTTIDGFKYAGINLTEKQYEDLKNLNLQMKFHNEIPVFHMMILLKILGLLPPEMVNDVNDNEGNNNFNNVSNDGFQRRYGKRKQL